MLVEISNIITIICTIVTCVVECANIVFNALKDLGIIDTEAHNADDLGARILTAEENGVTRDSFEDFDSWKEYINNIEVEDSNKFDPEEKAKKSFEYDVESIHIYLDKDLSPYAYGHLFENMNYFEENNRLDYILEHYKDIDNIIIDIGNYLENKIVGYQAEQIKDKLIDIEMAINPNITRNEAIDNIYENKK